MHRFQISTFGAIAIVFAVFGVNQGIFSGDTALDAMSAGWLILAIVDILWVLYFTSEEDSLSLHIFNSMGTGGLTPPSRRRRTRAQSSIHNMTTNGGYAANYSAGGGIGSHDVPYDTKMGSGVGSGVGSGGMGVRSQNSFGGASLDGGVPNRSNGGGSLNNAPIGSGGPGSIGGGDQNMGPSSPLMGSGAAGVGAGGGSGSGSAGAADANPQPESYSYKAKALYACGFCCSVFFFPETQSLSRYRLA